MMSHNMSSNEYSNQALQLIELETGDSPDAAIIWLHGLGASGDDFVPIVPELKLPESLRVRFLFPHAPRLPVTINGGMVMPAWYDILEMSINRQVDREQLERSAELVAQIVDQEIARGIKPERIILAGFSQGGAVAYQLALSSQRKLGGLMALSTYFATQETIELSDENAQLPILIQHGVYDPVVPEQLGQMARDTLLSKDYSVDYKTYPMDHSVCPAQILDISQWIQQRLI